MVMMETSRLRTSSKLYTVEGVMPERLASSLTVILRCLHNPRMRSATASLTFTRSPQGDCKKQNACAYTHLRIFLFYFYTVAKVSQ